MSIVAWLNVMAPYLASANLPRFNLASVNLKCVKRKLS